MLECEKISTEELQMRYKVTILLGFSRRLENMEKWKGIFQSEKSQGILNRLENSGKITQKTGISDMLFVIF